MSASILFQSANIVRAGQPGFLTSDVLIRAGKYERIAAGISPNGIDRVVPAAGKILLPGLFDMHAHIGEPGFEDAETIATVSAAAINGGFTGLLAQPDTSPPIDNGGMVQSVLDLISRSSPIPIHVCGCITKGRRGEELAEIGDMKSRGALMITDDGRSVSNPLILRRALQYARDLDVLVASHCDVRELSGAGAMNDGRVSYRLGLPGIPACSEEICIARDIRLAQSVRASIHIKHISTAKGVEIVKRYKGEGVHLSAEVTPHHLIFCDEDVRDYDTNFKVKPPLRTKADGAALLEAVVAGDIDVIATDHYAHTEFAKQNEFGAAPFGMIGLDTALISLHHHFISKGLLPWHILLQRMSATPRELLGLRAPHIAEGEAVDCILFDPQAVTLVDGIFLKSKSRNTPFLRSELLGRVEMNLLGTAILLEPGKKIS